MLDCVGLFLCLELVLTAELAAQDMFCQIVASRSVSALYLLDLVSDPFVWYISSAASVCLHTG